MVDRRWGSVGKKLIRERGVGGMNSHCFHRNFTIISP